MACNCKGDGIVTNFIVTDPSGNCLLTTETGGCAVFNYAMDAANAATAQGLSGFQIRPT